MGKQERKPSREDASLECPEVRRPYYDGPDTCDLVDKVCLQYSGLQCDIYDEYLEEIKKEEEDDK